MATLGNEPTSRGWYWFTPQDLSDIPVVVLVTPDRNGFYFNGNPELENVSDWPGAKWEGPLSLPGKEPATTSVPHGDGEIVTYHVATPTVTWADLQELGFSFDKARDCWAHKGGPRDVVVDLTHADPDAFVGDEGEAYAPRFFGVRTRDDVAALLRLIGERRR